MYRTVCSLNLVDYTQTDFWVPVISVDIGSDKLYRFDVTPVNVLTMVEVFTTIGLLYTITVPDTNNIKCV